MCFRSRKRQRRVARSSCCVIAALCLLATGCRREERNFTHGGPSLARIGYSPRASLEARDPQNGYEANAFAVSEGRNLYLNFNCVGCHAHGGGDFGPALRDAKWIYGSDAASIYQTIMDGRPNGMPAFRHKVTESQAWQLAAYVRSLSGQVSFGAAPGRTDHLKTSPPPSSVPRKLSQPTQP